MKNKHIKDERSLVIIKPDGVQRALIGEVVKRFEQVGLKLVAMKMMNATKDLIEKHYTLDPEWRRLTGEKSIKGYLDKGLKPPSMDPLVLTEKILNLTFIYQNRNFVKTLEFNIQVFYNWIGIYNSVSNFLFGIKKYSRLRKSKKIISC
jgi:nucleoside diphosphate kinase